MPRNLRISMLPSVTERSQARGVTFLVEGEDFLKVEVKSISLVLSLLLGFNQ